MVTISYIITMSDGVRYWTEKLIDNRHTMLEGFITLKVKKAMNHEETHILMLSILHIISIELLKEIKP